MLSGAMMTLGGLSWSVQGIGVVGCAFAMASMHAKEFQS